MTTELTHALNLEKIKPSYNRVVVAGALKGLIEVQKSCHLQEKPVKTGQKGENSIRNPIILDDTNLDEDQTNRLQLWWAYAKNDCYLPIRLAALECIIDFLTDLNPATSGHRSTGSAANS